MTHDLHDISYQLGSIRGTLEAIEKNTSDIKTEVKHVSIRVTKIESEKQFQRGVESQNKKISGLFGSLFGMVGGSFVTWIFK